MRAHTRPLSGVGPAPPGIYDAGLAPAGLLIRYACISILKHDEWPRHGDFERATAGNATEEILRSRGTSLLSQRLHSFLPFSLHLFVRLAPLRLVNVQLIGPSSDIIQQSLRTRERERERERVEEDRGILFRGSVGLLRCHG